VIRNIILTLILTAPLLASSQAGEYLDNPISPRSAALGNVETGLYKDAFSAEHNPAGLGQFNHTLVNASTARLFGEVQQRHISIGYSLWENATIGYSYMDNTVENIMKTTSEGVDTGVRFGYRALSHRIATGFKLPYLHDAYLGVAARLMRTELDQDYAQALGIDAGLQVTLTPFAKLGVMAENINSPKLVWTTDLGTEEPLPYKLSTGVAINLADNLDIYADISRKENEDAEHHIGIEWHVLSRESQHLQIRGGLAPQKLNAGVGLRFGGVTLDYAYTAFNETYMEASHTMSLSIAMKHKKKAKENPSISLYKYTRTNKVSANRKQVGISGITQDLKSLWINGQKVVIRRDKKFYHIVPLNETYNSIEIKGRTKRGKTITQTIEFIKR
jgi:hypothetical protein